MLWQIQWCKYFFKKREQCLKDQGVGWLLLNWIHTLQKDNETVKAFNQQLIVKYESHQASVAASIGAPITYDWRENQLKSMPKP